MQIDFGTLKPFEAQTNEEFAEIIEKLKMVIDDWIVDKPRMAIELLEFLPCFDAYPERKRVYRNAFLAYL